MLELRLTSTFITAEHLTTFNRPTPGGHSLTVSWGTQNQGTTYADYSTPSIFSFYQVNRFGAFTAGGSFFVTDTEPYHDDLTDGAGHGVLVATDRIYCQISSTGTGAAQQCTGKIWYRWKNVTLPEYIGIVQSQQ